MLWQGLPRKQGSGGLPHGGAGLYAIAALAYQPVKAWRLCIKAINQITIGRKGAQTCPSVRGAADLQRGGFFNAVDAHGDVELFGLHVVRGNGVGVGGGAYHLACVGFDVPVFKHA